MVKMHRSRRKPSSRRSPRLCKPFPRPNPSFVLDCGREKCRPSSEANLVSRRGSVCPRGTTTIPGYFSERRLGPLPLPGPVTLKSCCLRCHCKPGDGGTVFLPGIWTPVRLAPGINMFVLVSRGGVAGSCRSSYGHRPLEIPVLVNLDTRVGTRSTYCLKLVLCVCMLFAKSWMTEKPSALASLPLYRSTYISQYQ